MKICKICERELEESQFSKGNRQCRKCKTEKSKEYRKKWHEENRDHVRRVVHEHYLTNKEEVQKRTKKWRQEHPEEFKKYWNKSREKNLEKRRARKILNYHVEVGNIKKPDICSNCWMHKKVQAHHEDYNKPLEVRWLCTQCHAYEHRRFK